MPKLPQDASSYLDDRRDFDPTAGAALGMLMTAPPGRYSPDRPPPSGNPPRKRGRLRNQGTTPGGPDTDGLRLDASTDVAVNNDRMLGRPSTGRPGTATPQSGGLPQRFTTNTTPPEIARQRNGQPGFTSQVQDQLNGAGQSRSQRWYGSMPKADAAQDQDD